MARRPPPDPLTSVDNPYYDKNEHLSIMDAMQVVEAIGTSQITLLIGSEKEPLTVPEGVLNMLTYFSNCLRNGFQETTNKTFELPDEETKIVKQLIACLVQPLEEASTIEAGKVALLADKWCCFDLRDAILNATWHGWLKRGAHLSNDKTLFKSLARFRDQTENHRMRFFPVDFLLTVMVRERETCFPTELTNDGPVCRDYAKWKWIMEINVERKRKFGRWPPGGKSPIRRLMNGVLSIDWTPQSDGTIEFANSFLDD